MSQPPDGFPSTYEEDSFGGNIVHLFKTKPAAMIGMFIKNAQIFIYLFNHYIHRPKYYNTTMHIMHITRLYI